MKLEFGKLEFHLELQFSKVKFQKGYIIHKFGWRLLKKFLKKKKENICIYIYIYIEREREREKTRKDADTISWIQTDTNN